jgi:hypothetical protein
MATAAAIINVSSVGGFLGRRRERRLLGLDEAAA